MRDVSYFAIDVWWPNIQGMLYDIVSTLPNENARSSGALAWEQFTQDVKYLEYRSGGLSANPNIDSSRSSSIYGGSSMQPKALQTLACIRV